MASEHGTNARYNGNKNVPGSACHCVDCTVAHAIYMRAYRHRMRAYAELGMAVEKAAKEASRDLRLR